MEAHADGDVILQRLHGRRKIGVVGGARDRKMELEIRILAVRLAVGGIARGTELPATCVLDSV